METLQECVAYENAHQNRPQILRRLKSKADERVRMRSELRSLTNIPRVEAHSVG